MNGWLLAKWALQRMCLAQNASVHLQEKNSYGSVECSDKKQIMDSNIKSVSLSIKKKKIESVYWIHVLVALILIVRIS